MRKALAIMVVLVFLSAGCATVCQHQAKYFEYKGRIAAALATVQATYPLVLAALDRVKENALDEEKFSAEANLYFAKVQVVDMMLDYLGKAFFDNFCPDESDVIKAEAAADVALEQAAELEKAVK